MPQTTCAPQASNGTSNCLSRVYYCPPLPCCFSLSKPTQFFYNCSDYPDPSTPHQPTLRKTPNNFALTSFAIRLNQLLGKGWTKLLNLLVYSTHPGTLAPITIIIGHFWFSLSPYRLRSYCIRFSHVTTTTTTTTFDLRALNWVSATWWIPLLSFYFVKASTIFLPNVFYTYGLFFLLLNFHFWFPVGVRTYVCVCVHFSAWLTLY